MPRRSFAHALVQACTRAFLPALALPLMLAPGLATAVDGVREISQTCAHQTGCFPGDAPGLPVTLSASGSYRLTSNVTFSATFGPLPADFIAITADRVTLDLNGFELRCSFPLTGNPCGSGVHNGIDVTGDGVRIRNGVISGMPSGGISATGNDVTVESVHVLDNNGRGILISGRAGVVRNCTSASNGSHGIFNGTNTGTDGNLTEGNVVRDNGGFGITGSSMVRNNVVSQNEDDGIATGQALIEGNTVRWNGGNGISADVSALVVGNVSAGNSGFGIAGVGGFSYRGNMISGNTLGTISATSGAALNTGGNACNGSVSCP